MSWAPFQLAALEFPPKKLFGNRDERMVAERRNHLEARHFIIFILFAQITTNCRNTRSLYETVLLRPEEVTFAVHLFLAALSEELVPGDAVVVLLSSQSRRRQRFPPVQTRHL